MAMAAVDNMEVEIIGAHRRLVLRCPRPYQVASITSAGGLIWTAFLFPITQADGLQTRALLLAAFILSLVVFSAVHLEPFMSAGPYTAAVALLVLLIFVLAGGPSNQRDMIPWLPLYVVAICFFTVLVHKIPWRITRPQQPHSTRFYTDTVFSPPAASYRSQRASSDWSDPRPPSQSYRNDDSHFQHMGLGPGSARWSDHTGYILNDLDGARRDPQAAFLFPGNSQFDLGRPTSHEPPPRTGVESSHTAVDEDLGHGRPSQDSAPESNDPLLDSYE